MRTQLKDLPFASEFVSSSLLVVCANDDDRVVAACGIRGLLNTLVLYVKEGYRSRGFGSQTLSQAINVAKKRKLDFVTLSVSTDNPVAFHLYERLGFKQVLNLRRSGQILMLLPLTPIGHLLFDALSSARFALPDTLLFYVHRWLYTRTL